MSPNTVRILGVLGHCLVGLVALVGLTGCHECINPFLDDAPRSDAVSTASVESARAYPPQAEVRKRTEQKTVVMAQDGTVGHYPLWWEDPFEDRGSNDGQFAWTWEDYVGMPYGLGRFILNTMAVPVSAVVQPPVPLMGSDGVTSRQLLGPDHDPEWLPAGGTSTPPDILEVGALTSAAEPPVGGTEPPVRPIE